MIILNFQLFRDVFFTPIFRNVKTFSMNIWHLFIVKISNSHNISFRQLTYPYMDGFSKFYLQLSLLEQDCSLNSAILLKKNLELKVPQLNSVRGTPPTDYPISSP